jgi:hypothetical protein
MIEIANCITEGNLINLKKFLKDPRDSYKHNTVQLLNYPL